MSPPRRITRRKEQSPVRPHLSLGVPQCSYPARLLLVLVVHERSEKSRSTSTPQLPSHRRCRRMMLDPHRPTPRPFPPLWCRRLGQLSESSLLHKSQQLRGSPNQTPLGLHIKTTKRLCTLKRRAKKGRRRKTVLPRKLNPYLTVESRPILARHLKPR
jgi:hypothetical protein